MHPRKPPQTVCISHFKRCQCTHANIKNMFNLYLKEGKLHANKQTKTKYTRSETHTYMKANPFLLDGSSCWRVCHSVRYPMPSSQAEEPGVCARRDSSNGFESLSIHCSFLTWGWDVVAVSNHIVVCVHRPTASRQTRRTNKRIETCQITMILD